jgi:predicted TIM-barrel enzyme
MAFTRKEILERLQNSIKQRIPIIGTGAGTGISAKFEEAGGTDLIIVYNSGRFRMAGRGSTAGLFAYGNANQIVVDMAWEVLPVVKHTPVLAGVNGSDPTIVDMRKFLLKLRDLGYSGVQNFPTMGLVEGLLRQTIEDTGMGYSTEVEMIRIAHELDIFTSPYVFNTKEAVDMVKAGADMIVAHMGCTIGGTIGVNTSTAVTLDDSVKKIQEIRDAAVIENPDIIVICHGGPLAEPEDAEYVLKRTKGVHGFYGASSAERLPVEKAITGHIKTFKTIKF